VGGNTKVALHGERSFQAGGGKRSTSPNIHSNKLTKKLGPRLEKKKNDGGAYPDRVKINNYLKIGGGGDGRGKT